MRKILFFLLLLVYYSSFFGEQIEVINLPIGKSLALAGDTVLANNGPLNVLTNPAMLAMVDVGGMIQYNKMFYFADTTYDIIGFSFKEHTLGWENSIAIAVGNFSSGKILVRNIEGISTGEEVEYIVSIGAIGFSSVLVTNKNYSLWLGLTGYGIREKININSYFFGGNIGLVFQYKLNSFFKALNFGTTIRGLGMNTNLLHNEAISFEFNKYKLIICHENYLQKSTKNKFRIALLVDFYRSMKNSITVEFGHNFGEHTKTYSCGIGLRIIDKIELSYSFGQHGYLKDAYNLTLVVRLF